jgi:hypothetical protein
MSDPQPARPGRSTLVSVLLSLIGIILVLPGLCSLLFSVVWLRSMLLESGYRPGEFDGLALMIMLPCAAIGAIGVGVIIFAIRR